MCGICGFVSKREISLTQLKEMNDTMYHRGSLTTAERKFMSCPGGIGRDLPREGCLLWICPHWDISRCIRITAGSA